MDYSAWMAMGLRSVFDESTIACSSFRTGRCKTGEQPPRYWQIIKH